MNKFITKIFKSAGVNAKVSKNSENPRFRVVENKLTLEGIVRPNRYTMKITDNTGKTIDNLSVVISNSNDIVNRINESINTLKMLSTAYDSQKLVEEDEEFDTVDVEAEDIPEASTLEDGLADLYNDILDVAEKAEGLADLADENDAEQLSEIIGIASSLYGCAIDVDEYREKLMPEDEDMEESVQRTSKGSVKKAIDSITIAESLLRKTTGMKNIVTALKDIKSELVVRG